MDAVAADVPLMSTEDGMLHVGRSIAPEGLVVRAHFRFTAPRKPPLGVTVTVDVLPVVAPAFTVTAVPDTLKLPVELLALTVRFTVPFAVVEPLVPVTVTTYAPVVVVAVVPIVSVEAPSVILSIDTEVGLRLQVGGLMAPAGLVVMAHVRATIPVNPFVGVTTMLAVFPVEAPATTVRAGLLMVKLPIAPLGVTVRFSGLFTDTEPLVPVRVTT